MSCTCTEVFIIQLHDGGARYPVIPTDRHSEISYYFDARCTKCNTKYEAPFARVGKEGQVLVDQMQDLPMVDRIWFSEQCGPFTCGCDQESLTPEGSLPHRSPSIQLGGAPEELGDAHADGESRNRGTSPGN
ncbi:hypothetical protein [Streptomyces sp. NPDC007205]|uniref:hypothetical protein n=1 Tax=Streptomyces sp. NPDC007205 TaxID=3154316 RepID=UPI0033E0EE47